MRGSWRRRAALLFATLAVAACSGSESPSRSNLQAGAGSPGSFPSAPSASTAYTGTAAPDDSGEAGDPAAPRDAGGSPTADASSDGTAASPADAGASVDASSRGEGGQDAGADVALQDAGLDCGDDPNDPLMLACTGLYADWPTRTIAAGVRAFAPGTELWSDGADKSRFILLPAGTKIDTSNFDEWSFPVGTKLWKEFRLGGQTIETRFLWKRDYGWFRTTYAWSLDGASATEMTAGQTNWNGTSYEIPAQTRCTLCHAGAVDGVLGFDAVGLAQPSATGLVLSQLVREGLLTQPPPGTIAVPGNATESAALAWLHANCGLACHNRTPTADAFDKGLFLRLQVADLGSVQSTDAWLTAVGKPSTFQPTGAGGMLLIAPGDIGTSAIYFRISHRDAPDSGTRYQMPPVDTHVVSSDGPALVAAWIQSMATADQ
jgi:hypothetical protein